MTPAPLPPAIPLAPAAPPTVAARPRIDAATFLKTLQAPGAMPPKNFGVLLYGETNRRKTTTLRTMPVRGLVIDVPQAEGGTLVLKGLEPRVMIRTIETWDEADEIFNFLKYDNPKMPGADAETRKRSRDDIYAYSHTPGWNNKRFDWVALDSATAMQELAQRKTVSDRDLASDPHIISDTEWGKIGNLVAEMIWKFKTLPLHVLWTAQEQAQRDGDGGRYRRRDCGPEVTPRILKAIKPSLMLIGRLTLEKGPVIDGKPTTDSHMRIAPTDGIVAKYRARPELYVPRIIRNPDLGQLIAYLLELPGAVVPDEVPDELALIPDLELV